MNETCDELFDGRLKLLQPEEGPRVNMDTVLLASWVKLRSRHSRFVEAGCASGAVSLMLSLRFGEKIHVTGLEIQSELVDLAKRNAEINSLDNVTFIHGDLRDKEILPRESFDGLVINPPYESLSRSRLSDNPSRSTARLEVSCTLDDVGEFAFRVLKARGRMFSVFTSQRLGSFVNAMTSHRLTPKRIRFVYPKMGYNSGIFLAECVKFGGDSLDILPPLIVRGDDNSYTPELLRAYEL